MADNFVLEQLVKIVKDLATLNESVEHSFSDFQQTLTTIEKTTSVIKNTTHQHEHQIEEIFNEIKVLKCNYDTITADMNKRIVIIEKQLKGYINKPDFKKIAGMIVGIAAVLTAILAIVKFWGEIKIILNI